MLVFLIIKKARGLSFSIRNRFSLFNELPAVYLFVGTKDPLTPNHPIQSATVKLL
jgi:hypothetical protein